MSHYYGNGYGSSLEDWRAYRRHQKYYENTYDRNSPYEQMKRDRHRINIMIPGLENNIWNLDPEPKSCRWCHEQLIMIDNGANLMCQACGTKTPTTSQQPQTNLKPEAQPETQTNLNLDTNTKPTLPKESKSSKLKQKDSLENKSFVITQDNTRRQRRSSFEETETEEGLSALNYFSKLYGNVGDY